MKVLHGMSEVAGQGIYSVKGLKENGVDVNMAVWHKNPNNYPVDIDLKINKNNKIKYPIYAMQMVLFAIEAMRKYDMFHFHFGYSLIPHNLDVYWLNKFKKEYYVEFHGADIRNIFKSIFYENFKSRVISNSQKRKMQKRLSKLILNSRGIILHDIELKPQVEHFGKPIYIVPLRLDMSKFEPVFKTNNEKPIIVHAPSERRGKGTEKILQILNLLDANYELVLVEGKTQEEAFEIYKKADIIIDQISLGTYGVFALEAMALGKPVITYISDEMKESFPNSLPIQSADFNTLRDVLQDLLIDKEKRISLGIDGRKYVERYHDNIKVTKYLAEIYKGNVCDSNLFNLL